MKRGTQTERLFLRISPKDLEWLRKTARQRKRTVTSLVLWAIELLRSHLDGNI